MSSVHHLREFIGERLTAAAAEIFSEFETTILRYEEELDRQRRLLDVCWRPEENPNRIDLQQGPVHQTELILTDQRLCNQERKSSLDQEDPEPPQIKEEQEEDQLHLKQEADTLMVTVFEESEPDPDGDQLVSLSSAGPQDQNWGSNENPERSPETADHTYVGRGHTSEELFSEDPLRMSHMRVHPVRNPDCVKRQHCCPICDKKYTASNNLAIHMRTHTGERPFSCQTCGEKFIRTERLRYHMRVHAGENSDTRHHLCLTCGKKFFSRNDLAIHTRSHTGEKPFPCRFCGKRFSISGNCKVHMRIHTGEKPFSCRTCGQGFTSNASLKFHTKVHTGRAEELCTSQEEN